MKRTARALLFLILASGVGARASQAQTRWLVGLSGGDSWDNYSVGIAAAAEIPFAKRYELDLKDTFSPVEAHVSLGAGRANITNAGGHIWLTPRWGLNGSVSDSMYDVTKVTKDADYAFGGVSYRGIIAGQPTRFTFDYIRQFNNGITPSGLESSHLQGFDLGVTTRMGCALAFCIRLNEEFSLGRVLTQSNPVCDGSFGGKITCARTAAFGGGVTAGLLFEFPRRRAIELETF
jgi:hypothetical protein